MNIFLDNVDIMSTTGPNHFANKLKKGMESRGHTFGFGQPFDLQLSFIQVSNRIQNIPLYLRLDGIYFNNKMNFQAQNYMIQMSYEHSAGVIFQTQFNKELIFKYFGEHDNYSIIRNGADYGLIDHIRKFKNPVIDRAGNKSNTISSGWTNK